METEPEQLQISELTEKQLPHRQKNGLSSTQAKEWVEFQMTEKKNQTFRDKNYNVWN